VRWEGNGEREREISVGREERAHGDRAGLQSGVDGQVKSKYIETTGPNVQPIWLQESEGVLQVKLNMVQ